MSSDWVIVGRIVRPHGLLGDLKVEPLTDNPGRFDPGKRIKVRSRGGEEVDVILERVRPLPNHLLVAFSSYESRTQVEPWSGGWLLVPEQDVPSPPEGEYYHFQILGMQVVGEETGEILGEVVEILSTGSNDVYVVRGGEKEYLIPALEEFVRKIDVPAKRMTIARTEGLA